MATNDSIQLRLINQSADANNSSIVIFQKNVSTNMSELPVAWMVVDNLGAGWIHPFSYDLDLEVGAADSWGNFVSPQASSDGQLWTVVKDSSGDQIKPTGPANSPSEIQVLNGLSQGAISACMYRSGQLLATKTGVAPGQKALFSFKPSIWIGVVSQVEQGEVLDSAIVSNINTQLMLTGIASADILMLGGGGGKASRAFSFELSNVKYA